jgi:hypothetical protein
MMVVMDSDNVLSEYDGDTCPICTWQLAYDRNDSVLFCIGCDSVWHDADELLTDSVPVQRDDVMVEGRGI